MSSGTHFCVIAFFLAPFAAADKTKFLSSTLGSNMVLQRDVSASIYGWAEIPNTIVQCTIDGNTIQTTSSPNSTADGNFPWVCSLPAYAGSFDEFAINVTAPETGQSAQLEGVVFGDVFLCGGQSNMEFAMPGMFQNDTEIPDADNYPFIRKCLVVARLTMI